MTRHRLGSLARGVARQPPTTFGPQGPTGATGSTGPAGPAGPTGPAGVGSIEILTGIVLSQPDVTWVPLGYVSIDPADFAAATRLELEAFISTDSATYDARFRLYNVTTSEQVGETLTSVSTTLERVRQAITFPPLVGVEPETYRAEYSCEGAAHTVTVSGVRLRPRSDTFALAFGALPELWSGLYGTVFPLTVEAGVPWIVTCPSAEVLDSGLGTGASQNATVNVPLLKSDVVGMILSAGGSITDSAGTPMGGPYLAREIQRFEYDTHPAGTFNETIAVSGEANRRLFLFANWRADSSVSTQINATLDGVALIPRASDCYQPASSYFCWRVLEILEADLPEAAGEYTLAITLASQLENLTVYVIELCDVAQSNLVSAAAKNEGNSTAPSGVTTTAVDNAMAFSFIAIGSSSSDGVSTLANGYVVDQWDGPAAGFQIRVGCSRVPSPGAKAMTWTIPTSRYWGSFVFNLAGA